MIYAIWRHIIEFPSPKSFDGDYNQINQYLVITYTVLSTVDVKINIGRNLIEEIM